MKRYLLGVFAIALAIGFSAFTLKGKNSSKSLQDVYWFSVDQSTISSGQIDDGDVTFLGTTGSSSTLPGNDPGCSSSPNYCLVYLTEEQVILDIEEHFDGINGSQTPQVVSRKQ